MTTCSSDDRYGAGVPSRHPRSTSHPLERALVLATKWTLIGASVSVSLLAVPESFTSRNRLIVTTVHLSVIVLSATVLSWRLNDLVDQEFFPDVRRPWLASTVSIVAVVVGFGALVTLASSAALRYDPSLQFLQLLSALDVAWSAAAFGFGMRVVAGSERVGRWAALALDAICVFSIWNYLRVVGFTSDGGWLVDRGELLSLVIPFDVAAAVMAISALIVADRRMTSVDSRR